MLIVWCICGATTKLCLYVQTIFLGGIYWTWAGEYLYSRNQYLYLFVYSYVPTMLYYVVYTVAVLSVAVLAHKIWGARPHGQRSSASL